jgi:hypothetical protein
MRLFIINSNNYGGSYKYILDLLQKNTNHYCIKNIIELNNTARFIKNNVLLLQYINGYDFTFNDIIKIVRKYNIKLIIPIHDFYFINSNDGHNIVDFHNIPTISHLNHELFEVAYQIICPSYFMYNIFIKFINNNIINKMIVQYHDDKLNYNENTYIPIINNNIINNINIGIITHINKIKGEDIYLELINKPYNFHIFGKVNNKKFNKNNVYLYGVYNEDKIYKLLIKNNIHGLLFLSNTPESYCYALTKGINSRLPILYTDIGAISERLAYYNNNYRFIKYNTIDDFNIFINYIKNNQGIGVPYNI